MGLLLNLKHSQNIVREFLYNLLYFTTVQHFIPVLVLGKNNHFHRVIDPLRKRVKGLIDVFQGELMGD